MPPHRQLTQLQVEKALLRSRIAARRTEFAGALAGLRRPLAWIDRARELWGRVAPILRDVVPAFTGGARGPTGWFAGLRRWIPAVTAVWWAFRTAPANTSHEAPV